MDFALTSMVVLFAALLLVPGALSRRAMSAALGLVFALGMLTKWTFFVYVIGPMFAILWERVRGSRMSEDESGKAPARAKGLVACGLIFVMTASLAAPWYLMNAENVLGRGGSSLASYREISPAGGFWSLMTGYLIRLVTDELFIPSFVLGLAGIILSIRRPKGLAFLLSWIVIPLPFFSSVGLPDLRYTLPIVPAFAIFAGLALSRLAWRRAPMVVAVIVVGVLLSQWFVLSFGVGIHYGLAFDIGGIHLPVWGTIAQEVRPPIKSAWPYREIFGRMHQSGIEHPSIFVIPVTAEMNPWTLKLETRLSGAEEIQVEFRPFDTPLDGHLDPLFASDFILLKDGDQGVLPFSSKAIVLGGLMLEHIRAGRIKRSLIARFSLPDGSSAYLIGPNRVSQGLIDKSRSGLNLTFQQLRVPDRPGKIVRPAAKAMLNEFPREFRWSPAENALWYVARLTGPTPALEGQVCGERLSISELQSSMMPEGDYLFEVAAANPKGQSRWVGVEFSVSRP